MTQQHYMYELTRISATHENIANYLIANPGKGQMERCAKEFGYTRSWLSTLIGQDAFKAMMMNKQGKVFEEVVIPLRDKIAGVAHRSVEKMGEILEQTKDERLVREIGKDMLSSLGYGANATVLVDRSTHNNLTVNAVALAEARERQSKHYGRNGESTSEPKLIPVEIETPKLPDSTGLEMGETRDLRAEHVNSETPMHGEPTEGSEIRIESSGPFGKPLW